MGTVARCIRIFSYRVKFVYLSISAATFGQLKRHMVHGVHHKSSLHARADFLLLQILNTLFPRPRADECRCRPLHALRSASSGSIASCTLCDAVSPKYQGGIRTRCAFKCRSLCCSKGVNFATVCACSGVGIAVRNANGVVSMRKVAVRTSVYLCTLLVSE